MKKILIYSGVTLVVVLTVAVIIAMRSVIHIDLPHGAQLHILPAPKDSQVRGAVVLCPGGGYRYLQKWTEGYMWFPYFHRMGYTVAMLEYRFPHQHAERYQTILTDGEEGMIMMREHADEWHHDPDNIGMMGFSAGGHLVSTFMNGDRDDLRPDFAILFYPVVSMRKELTHKRTHDSLLGEDPSEEMEDRFSNELHVSERTPPAYIVMIPSDTVVNPQNAQLFYDAMRAHHRPVTLHKYDAEGHGWGFQLFLTWHSPVLEDLKNWMENSLKSYTLQSKQ